jgi:hypothetical protein
MIVDVVKYQYIAKGRSFKRTEYIENGKVFVLSINRSTFFRTIQGQESELQEKIKELERSINERDKLLRAKTIECNDERITKEMYKKMIDIAEEHYNIHIVKKHGAK